MDVDFDGDLDVSAHASTQPASAFVRQRVIEHVHVAVHDYVYDYN